MDRLTHKGAKNAYILGGIIADLTNTYFPNNGVHISDLCYKLGVLEDIEEELGTNLDVIFKALKNGVYDIEKKQTRKISYINKHFIGYIGDSIGNGDADYPDIQYCYRIKDYGITWALTKEELT